MRPWYWSAPYFFSAFATHFERLHPLREDDRFAACCLGDLLHVGDAAASSFALSPVSGSKLQIMLQPHDELEHVLHGDGVAEFVQVNDRRRSRRSVVGRVLGIGVSSTSANPGSPSAACRTEHVVLRAAQDQNRTSYCPDAAWRGGQSAGMRPGSMKSEDVHQVVGVVLDGRAGERPAPAPLDSGDRTTCAVLESLFLIRCASSRTTASNVRPGSIRGEVGSRGVRVS